MTLSGYCADLKNYFINDLETDIHLGEYTISNGVITLDFLANNQYFRICGSVFNDGVYKYNDDLVLTNEKFTGAIWAMSIPKDFLEIVNQAENYLQENPNANSIQSESFGGYSYTKATGTSTGFWYLPSAISDKLNRYRKLRVI